MCIKSSSTGDIEMVNYNEYFLWLSKFEDGLESLIFMCEFFR